MNKVELFSVIKEAIVKNHPELELNIKPESRFAADLALDSVDYLELITLLEEKYLISFDDADLINAPKSISGLIDLILKKIHK